MPRKNKSSAPAAPRPLTGPQRLNKILAAAGLGSRREVEQYIVDGRIEVDGNPVTDLATKVDPESAKLTFDGSAIRIFRPVYFALNKPVGVLSTNRDPSGRMRAIDLINVKERIFSAGRLDRSSEGLMLLTNDGELAQRLAHPRYGIQKLYMATVQGEVTQVDLEKLIRGVRLAEGYAKVDAVKVRRQRSGSADLEIALSEGKNREIRRILARLGHKVVALKRLAIGPLRLGQLPTGGWRPLTRDEIQALYSATIGGRRKKRGTGKPARKRTPSENMPPEEDDQLSLGQFDHPSDSFYDDDDDGDEGNEFDGDFEDDSDDFGGHSELDPNLLNQVELEYQQFSDEDDEDDDGEIIELHGHSAIGTVISYEDEESEDGPSSDDGVASPRARRQQSSSRPDRSSRPRSGSSRSPHDLRNRQRSTDEPSSEGRQASGPRSNGPRSTRPKAARPGSERGASRSNSQARSSTGSRGGSKPRTGSGPRSGPARSGAKVARGGYRSSTAGEGSSRSSGPSTERSAGRSVKRSTARPTGKGSSRPAKGSSRAPTKGPSKGASGRGGSGASAGGRANSRPSSGGAKKPGMKKRGNGRGGSSGNSRRG